MSTAIMSSSRIAFWLRALIAIYMLAKMQSMGIMFLVLQIDVPQAVADHGLEFDTTSLPILKWFLVLVILIGAFGMGYQGYKIDIQKYLKPYQPPLDPPFFRKLTKREAIIVFSLLAMILSLTSGALVTLGMLTAMYSVDFERQFAAADLHEQADDLRNLSRMAVVYMSVDLIYMLLEFAVCAHQQKSGGYRQKTRDEESGRGDPLPMLTLGQVDGTDDSSLVPAPEWPLRKLEPVKKKNDCGLTEEEKAEHEESIALGNLRLKNLEDPFVDGFELTDYITAMPAAHLSSDGDIRRYGVRDRPRTPPQTPPSD